jgi:hypothetical protein
LAGKMTDKIGYYTSIYHLLLQIVASFPFFLRKTTISNLIKPFKGLFFYPDKDEQLIVRVLNSEAQKNKNRSSQKWLFKLIWMPEIYNRVCGRFFSAYFRKV